jgi:hypothetical protein
MFAELGEKQWLVASITLFGLLLPFVYSHGLEGKPGSDSYSATDYISAC